MSAVNQRPSESPVSGVVRLSAYLLGVLSGGTLAVLAGIVFEISTNSLTASVTVDRFFVIKVALFASALVVTAIASVMAIRSQIRARVLMTEIERLYEKTEFLSRR